MGGFAAAFDERIASVLRSLRARSRTGVGAPLRIEDPGQIVHEMRLRKEPRELQAMRKAVELTRRGHLAAMKVGRPGAHEYELQAALEREFRGGARGRPRCAPHVARGGAAPAPRRHPKGARVTA